MRLLLSSAAKILVGQLKLGSFSFSFNDSSRRYHSNHMSTMKCDEVGRDSFASDRLKWLSKVGGNVPRGGDETKPQPADPPSFDGVVARTNKLLLSLATASTSAPPMGKYRKCTPLHRAETPPLKAPARLTTCSNAQCSASGVLRFLLHARDECRLDILTVEREYKLARGIFEETREHGATAHSVASTRETPPLTPAPTTPDLPAAVATAISAINGSRNWNSSGGHVAAAPRSPPLHAPRPDACRRRADPHTPAPARRTRPRTPASSSAAAAATRAVDRAALISLSAAAAAFSSASRAFAVARGSLD